MPTSASPFQRSRRAKLAKKLLPRVVSRRMVRSAIAKKMKEEFKGRKSVTDDRSPFRSHLDKDFTSVHKMIIREKTELAKKLAKKSEAEKRELAQRFIFNFQSHLAPALRDRGRFISVLYAVRDSSISGNDRRRLLRLGVEKNHTSEIEQEARSFLSPSKFNEFSTAMRAYQRPIAEYIAASIRRTQEGH